MRTRLAFTAAFALAASPVAAETLTIAVSSQDIHISSNFTGTGLTLFGVIETDRDAAPPGDYHVAVLMLGPRETVVARRKDRIVGIWANGGAETILSQPSFYSLHTSDALASLASPAVLSRLQLGFDNLAFVYADSGVVNDPSAQEFRDAFIRLKREARLFQEAVDVGFIGKLVFRATAQLPANIPTGRYTVSAYVFSGGELVAHASEPVDVAKTGAEEAMSWFARSQSLAYGVICALLAVFVGWLGGVIFRRD